MKIIRLKFSELKPDEGGYTWEKLKTEVDKVIWKTSPRDFRKGHYITSVNFGEKWIEIRYTFSIFKWWRIRKVINKYRK